MLADSRVNANRTIIVADTCPSAVMRFDLGYGLRRVSDTIVTDRFGNTAVITGDESGRIGHAAARPEQDQG